MKFCESLHLKNCKEGKSIVEDYTKIIYNRPIENHSENGVTLNKLFSLAGIKYDPKVINTLKKIIKT